MPNKLYIKTDGPIPEDCDYITAGKVYEAEQDDILADRWWIYPNEEGRILVAVGEPSIHLGDKASFHFCDPQGKPVPAPWEKPKPINWQAHAEALAEALRKAEDQMVEDAKTLENEYNLGRSVEEMDRAGSLPDAVYKGRAALAAFDQDRGKA